MPTNDIQAHTYAASANFIVNIMVSCVVVRKATIVLLSCVAEASCGARKETNVAGQCIS